MDPSISFSLADSSENEEKSDTELENCYYQSKQLMLESPNQALINFKKIIANSETKPLLIFRCLKQILLIFLKLNDIEELKFTYQKILSSSFSISQNKYEKSIMSVFHLLSSRIKENDLMLEICNITQKSIENEKCYILNLYSNFKIADVLYKKQEYSKFLDVIPLIKEECIFSKFSHYDNARNKILEQILVNELDYYFIQKDFYKMKEFQKTLETRSLIERFKRSDNITPTSFIISLAHDCRARIYILHQEYESAYSKILETLKSYQMIGNSRNITCFWILLLLSVIKNHYAQPSLTMDLTSFKQHKEFETINKIICIFRQKDLNSLLSACSKIKHHDPCIKVCLDALLTKRRKQVIESLDRHTKYPIEYISSKLYLPLDQVPAFMLESYKTSAPFFDQISETFILYEDDSSDLQ